VKLVVDEDETVELRAELARCDDEGDRRLLASEPITAESCGSARLDDPQCTGTFGLAPPA
jgi:hypothetical protein